MSENNQFSEKNRKKPFHNRVVGVMHNINRDMMTGLLHPMRAKPIPPEEPIPENEFDKSLDFDVETYQKEGKEYVRRLTRMRQVAHESDMERMAPNSHPQQITETPHQPRVPVPPDEIYVPIGGDFALEPNNPLKRYTPLCNVVMDGFTDKIAGTLFTNQEGAWFVVEKGGHLTISGSDDTNNGIKITAIKLLKPQHFSQQDVPKKESGKEDVSEYIIMGNPDFLEVTNED